MDRNGCTSSSNNSNCHNSRIIKICHSIIIISSSSRFRAKSLCNPRQIMSQNRSLLYPVAPGSIDTSDSAMFPSSGEMPAPPSSVSPLLGQPVLSAASPVTSSDRKAKMKRRNQDPGSLSIRVLREFVFPVETMFYLDEENDTRITWAINDSAC